MMFNFIDSDLKKRIKPGIIIASFTVLLIYFLINLNNIFNFVIICNCYIIPFLMLPSHC